MDWREPGVTASPGAEGLENRASVILTPDQRVRVFISSTLEELAEERAAARRAIRRLHLVPVWYESGAPPDPPQSMYRAYLEQSQIFVGIYWQRYAGWVRAWRSLLYGARPHGTALEEAHRVLGPSGTLIDIHPVFGTAQVEVHRAGQVVRRRRRASRRRGARSRSCARPVRLRAS